MIVVGGMIGLGKTSVAEMLAEAFDSEVFYESVDDNPILPLFYTLSEQELNQKRIPFLLQLFFLDKRFRDIKRAFTHKNNVVDRSIYEDWYFAKVNHDLGRISDLEMSLYENLLQSMMEEIDGMKKKAPDLMVYLKASFETVMERIGLRGRDFEQDRALIEYYRTLWNGYDDWLYNHYNASQVLVIDMDNIDIVNNPQDRKIVIAQVKERIGE